MGLRARLGSLAISGAASNTEGAFIEIIENGRILRSNLRAEMLSVDELMSQLREEGIEDVKEVKLARLEGDGRLSVIRQAN